MSISVPLFEQVYKTPSRKPFPREGVSEGTQLHSSEEGQPPPAPALEETSLTND